MLIAALSAFPYALDAQELAPLSEILDGDFERSYPFVRCAAFYQASIEWAGTEQFDEVPLESTKTAISDLVLMSSLVRVEKTKADPEQLFEQSLRDVRNVADKYRARFEDNYASSGQAWMSDPVWECDNQLCQ